MATYQTYQQIGIKEEISDIIENISPTKTPFQSSIGREKINNTLFQWQEDTLRAVAANAAVEGANPTDITAVPTVMRTNFTQIMTESLIVSGTADVVSTYGRAKETAYQLAKSSAQVKRDLENALVGAPAVTAKAAGSSGVARTMAGFQAQINVSGTSNLTVTGSGQGSLTEAFLLANLQIVYNAGADPTVVSVTPIDSVIVANFATSAGRPRPMASGSSGDMTVVNAVNVYVSPFGETKIVLNRFQKTLNTLVYDPEMWKLAVLRPWARVPLAQVGDATRNMIVGEFSLKHLAASASGVVAQTASGF